LSKDMKAAVLILAAGAGRRLGQPKASVELGGRRLIDRAIDTAARAGCVEVIAVTRADLVVEGARRVVNPDPDRGMASSLVLGLSAAVVSEADCVVVMLVDQPGITAASIAAVLAPTRAGRMVFATYAGRRAHPVRIDRNLWAPIMAGAAGEIGARGFARIHPHLVDDVASDGLADPRDVDNLADLTRWRAVLGDAIG
jgi:CTP:molybdopterin cytidylyltransferase MocA